VRRAESTNSAGLIADSPGGKQVGDVTMRRSIGDYHSLLAGAVSALERGNAEAREEMYERTRAALRAGSINSIRHQSLNSKQSGSS
jgi:hypothetical protein